MYERGEKRRGRNILNTPARAARKQEARRRLLVTTGLIAALCAVIIGAISWGLHRPQIRIQATTVSGTQVLHADDVATFAKEALKGKYFFLFPKNSAFLYSDSSLAMALTSHFPRIENVRTELNGLQTLQITLTERTPAALWCGEVYESIAEMRECFFLDAQGLVFAPAPEFSGNAYVSFYGSLTDTMFSQEQKEAVPLGKEFLTPEEFISLTTFAASTGTILSPVSALVVASSGRIAMLSQGAEVRFSDGQDIGKLSANFAAAVDAKRKEGKHDMLTDLIYIDLRLADTSGRVYFKFKN